MISQHSQVYFCFFVSQILHFETQIALRFVPVASAAVHVLLCCAHGMSDTLFVYVDRAELTKSSIKCWQRYSYNGNIGSKFYTSASFGLMLYVVFTNYFLTYKCDLCNTVKNFKLKSCFDLVKSETED